MLARVAPSIPLAFPLHHQPIPNALDDASPSGSFALPTTCPRCRGSIPANVSFSAHEASCPFLRSLSLPQDGRPPVTYRSNDNSLRSTAGSGTAPLSPASPTTRDDSIMSDAASTTASHYSPGHSVAFSDGSSFGGRTYHLEVVQHPERTAEIGATSLLSRLPLSPPLVVKLTVEDGEGNDIPAHTEMPFLTAHVGLYNENGTDTVDIVQPPSSSDPERMLYGTLVSSLHHLKDTNNQPGMFFIFPDVSVRRRGTYTLLVNLLRLTSLAEGTSVMPVGMDSTALTSVITDAFSVVPQNEFIAPAATQLTSCFHRQGARMYTPFQR